MIRAKAQDVQGVFWVEAQKLPPLKAGRFYERVNETLRAIKFAEQVHAACAPFYSKRRDGRPPIDPVVFFKLAMVGFFEGLQGDRAVAARAEDSISVRAFLGYALDEATPDHSSLSGIRRRLGHEVFEALLSISVAALLAHGLLQGRNLGIDSSIIEANASLRNLVERNTEEDYRDYVRRLAQEAGVDPDDDAAVRKFDRKRPDKKMSNEQFKHAHDEDARIGRTKDGACDMVYKPEIVVDLDTGAIVAAEVRPGDAHDAHGATDRLLAAEQRLQQVSGQDLQKPAPMVAKVVSDKGYFTASEVAQMQEVQFETVICDPMREVRKLDALPDHEAAAVRAAWAQTDSEAGRALLRQRGQHLERAFAHVLDAGGQRRTTLRGRANIAKRFVAAAAIYNLSQLLRALFACGTVKQAVARSERAAKKGCKAAKRVVRKAKKALLDSLRALAACEALIWADAAPSNLLLPCPPKSLPNLR